MAESLDGVIAHDKDHVANWTSKEDKQFFVAETRKGGAIVFGRNTFATFGDRPLPNRLNYVMTLDPADKKMEKPGLLEFVVKASPAEVIKAMKSRGFKKLFIGGGSMINGLFLDAKLIDEIWLTIEPKVFGSGLRVFSDIQRDINLKLKSVKRANQTVILKYGVNYGNSDQK